MFKIYCLVLLILVGSSIEHCTDAFKDAFIDKHNQLRERHDLYPLVSDDALDKLAEQTADQLASKNGISRLLPPENTTDIARYAVSIFKSWSSNGAHPIPSDLIQHWYDEMVYYSKHFGDEPDLDTLYDWNHFTQIVWKDTKRLGVGCVTKRHFFYVVACYDPPGNVRGTYRGNVTAPVANRLVEIGPIWKKIVYLIFGKEY